jgi:hypothetical protein
VVVNRTGLADFPADGEEFVERSFVDQVSRVVLAVPDEIGGERIGIHGSVVEEFFELLGMVECGLGEAAELGYEVVDWYGLYGGGHGTAPGRV